MEDYPSLFSSTTTPQNSDDLQLLNMANSDAHEPNNGYEYIEINGKENKNHDEMQEQEQEQEQKKSRKLPKYAFQTRSQVDILDDGYRWRKYGQKAVKNNKFPRSYYRCTHEGCNVKKQIQRLSKDEGIVVTTYEGIHSHPILKSTDNFQHILTQMQIYNPIPYPNSNLY